MTDTTRKVNPVARWLFLAAGVVLTFVGAVGVVTPGWPGTIFLILAAGCFARSSPKLEAWLVEHPRLGPSVVAWRQTGAISRPVKFIAIGSMIVSFVLVLVVSQSLVWTAVAGVCLLASAIFVGTRPGLPKQAG
jgi:uncharacterized membrane protein YbaN (DUF454 family)